MEWQKAARDIDKNYRDNHQIIAYRQNGFWDGGDSLQMTAFYYYGLWLYGKPELLRFVIEAKSFTISPGVFRRHPERNPKWAEAGQRDIARWNDPEVLSRDNLMPFIIACGAHEIRIRPALKAIVRRGFRSQNGDPIWLHHFAACFIRAPRVKWAYPVLLLTDLFLVIGAIIDLIRTRTKPLSGKGYKNAFMLISQAYHTMPTPISWLARQLYRLRPGGLQGGLSLAFGAYDDPPFDELWSEYTERMYR